MKLNRYAVGAAVLTLTAAAFAVQPFMIMVQPKEGQTNTYKTVGKFDIMGMGAEATFMIESKIVKVTDTTYEETSRQYDGMVNVGGQEMEMPSESTPTTTATMDFHGLTTAFDDPTGMAGPDGWRMATLGTVYRPAKQLNPGDEWTHKFKGNDDGAVEAEGSYKLIGEETWNGMDVLKIEYTVKETAGSMPASSTGTSWIRKSDNIMVRNVANWKDVPVGGAPEPISGTFTTELVK